MSLGARIKGMVRESSIYSLSWVASSVTGVLMLPIYTAYIPPREYGIVNLLEYTAEYFTIAILGGQVPAIYRYFNDSDSPEDRRGVIGTGFLYVAVSALVAVGIAALFHRPLSALVLGRDVDLVYIRVGLAVLLFDVLILVPTAYFAAAQKPVTYLLYSLGRLVVGLTANVYFIVFHHLGALGMLLGNLTSSSLFAVLMSLHVVRANGVRFRIDIARGMLMFGLPLVPGIFASALMHNLDRYMLKAFRNLHDVGIYSLGAKFPLFLSMAIGFSFNLVWSGNAMYGIAKEPDARRQFATIATYFITGMAFLEYILAIGADTLITVMADPAYRESARVLPVVCIAMTVYACHHFFTVGAYLTNKTWLPTIAHLVGVAASVGLNVLFVPRYGYMGAAWVSAAAYGVVIVVIYVLCRAAYPIDFELGRIFRMAVATLGLFGLYRLVPHYGWVTELAQQALFVLAYPLALLLVGFFSRAELVTLRRILGNPRSLLGD